jgi:hypothetical protein
MKVALFVAAKEFGTSATSRHVCFAVVLGAKADMIAPLLLDRALPLPARLKALNRRIPTPS